MKVAYLIGIGKFEIREVPKPEAGPGEALVRLYSVGVCGSDVHYYTDGKIGEQIVKYPFVVGHECAGVVEEVGEGVTGLKPGERVSIEPAIHCGECFVCRMGRENICPHTRFLGCPGQVEGSFKEYITMPAKNCIPIPDDMSFDEAVITEPLAISLHAVKLSNLEPGESVAILGSGPIGLLAMLCARHFGAGKTFATDVISERVDFAQNFGATGAYNYVTEDIKKAILDNTEGHGVDIVYECAGKQETMDQALEILRPGGKLLLIGIPSIERVSFIADRMRRNEILIQNVRRQNRNVDEAIWLVAKKKIDAERLVTHRFRLDEIGKAFEIVSSYKDGVIKAMIDMGDDK